MILESRERLEHQVCQVPLDILLLLGYLSVQGRQENQEYPETQEVLEVQLARGMQRKRTRRCPMIFQAPLFLLWGQANLHLALQEVLEVPEDLVGHVHLLWSLLKSWWSLGFQLVLEVRMAQGGREVRGVLTALDVLVAQAVQVFQVNLLWESLIGPQFSL